MFHPRFFTFIFVLFFSLPVLAQPVKVKNYEFNLGFYVGRPTLWGDYNGGFFGQSYPYRSGDTPQFNIGKDVNYGVTGWLPLRWGFSFRPAIENGTLTYGIDDIEYKLNTPYRIYSFGFQYDVDFDSDFTPYLYFGYDVLKFTTPRRNEDAEFILNSQKESYQAANTNSIPLTLGFTYDLGSLSSFFAEATFRFTQSDHLDNFAPEVSNFRFQNDMLFSYQAGLRVKVVDVIRLLFEPAKPQAVFAFTPSQPAMSLRAVHVDLMPLPQKTSLLPVSPPITAVPKDSVPPETAPDEPIAEAEISLPTPPLVTPPIIVPIPVVDETNRVFDRAEELKKMEELKKAKQEAEPTTQPEKNPNTTLTWDPTVPILQTKPTDIPTDIVKEGFVTSSPPEGYYVQVFATVGPITASRNRNTTIEILKKEGILADPDRQVVIIKRKQFYEVRIGVFENYENTLQVLKTMQGTYFDSYTLIYLPDNQ